ncbi:MAG: hypothetical protein JWR21_3834 [Herminiimonas sp.]|nr:hypothetical protein [Herminiimonas sp.]
MFVHGPKHTPPNLPTGTANDRTGTRRPVKVTVAASASPIHIPSNQDSARRPVPIPRTQQSVPATMWEEGVAKLEKDGNALRDQEGYKAFVSANNFFFARGCDLEKKGQFGKSAGSNLYSAHLPGAVTGRLTNIAPRLKRNQTEYAKEKINAFSAAVRGLDPRKRRSDPLASPAAKIGIHAAIASAREGKVFTAGLAATEQGSALSVADSVAGVAAGVTAGIYAVLSTSDAIDICASKREAERVGFANHVGARECMACLLRNETPTAEQSAAYCTFMAASRRLSRFNEHVRKNAERAQLAVLRDNTGYVPQAIVSNAKQIGATAGTIVGTGAQVLGSISGFLGVLTGALYVADGASVATQQSGRIRELKAAAQTRVNVPDSASVLRALSKPFDDNIERLHRQAKRERGFAISRIVKGSMESVIGAVGTGCGIALVVGVGVGTAGIALAVAGAALSVCFVASCAVKAGYAWKSEHTSKQRQRFAEQIAATMDRKELAQIFESAYLAGGDRRERNMRVVHTGDRQTGVQDKVIRLKRMDIVSNEYLALEVLAGFILDQSRAGLVNTPQAVTAPLLASDGNPIASEPTRLTSVVRQPIAAEAMTEIEFTQIINVLRQRRDAAEKAWQKLTPKSDFEKQQFFLDHDKADLWFIKASIAPSLGLKLRSAAGGKPNPVPAVVYRDAFVQSRNAVLDVARRADKKKGTRASAAVAGPNMSKDELFQKTTEALFGTVSRAEFLAAAKRVEDREDQLELGDWEMNTTMKAFVDQHIAA